MAQKPHVVIVGGGIAGLYAAYRLSLVSSNKCRVTLLEKETVLGGRAGVLPFAGTTVLTGAGVGRKRKDHRLLALLQELGVEYKDFVVQQQNAPGVQPAAFVKRHFLELRRAFAADRKPAVTFRAYALSKLDPNVYRDFVQASGYSDYEQADANDVFYHYGFDDNFAPWDAMRIPWKELVDTLAQASGRVKIIKSARVTHVVPGKEVRYNDNTVLACNLVILATTVEVVQKLLPLAPVFRHIHSQPFLRVYGQFAKACRARVHAAVPTTTVVPGPLHKFIPMDADKGVYMIAYTDNADVRRVDTSSLTALSRLAEDALSIGPLEVIKAVVIPWSAGTHYNAPLDSRYRNRKAFVAAAQRPYPGLYVVGEMVSLHNQGWVEGALESVDDILQQV